MYKATCTLVGESPISFGKVVDITKKNKGEKHDQFELRTWKEKLHTNEKGDIFIPAPALKKCLEGYAKYSGEKIAGKGNSTYTKHFEAGVMVLDDIYVGVNEKKVDSIKVHVPSDGKRGGTTRVWKTFPLIKKWSGKAVITVLDETVDKDKLKEYLTYSGMFIGLLRWRPRQGGLYGRFSVKNFKVEKIAE